MSNRENNSNDRKEVRGNQKLRSDIREQISKRGMGNNGSIGKRAEDEVEGHQYQKGDYHLASDVGSDGDDKVKQVDPIQIIAELIGGIIVGGAMGYFLDNFFGTLPLFFIIFFMLGMVAGVYNIYKICEHDGKKSNVSSDKGVNKGVNKDINKGGGDI